MTAFDKELEQDPRETKSEPSDPKPEWTNGVPQPKAEILDNVYAESKPPDPIANIGKTYTDADTQIMPDEFGKTISRQGVDYLTVDGPDSSAYKRKEKNKKRGRKNQYYTQIDAEDDEEAEHLDELQKEIKVDDHQLGVIREEELEDKVKPTASKPKTPAGRPGTRSGREMEKQMTKIEEESQGRIKIEEIVKTIEKVDEVKKLEEELEN